MESWSELASGHLLVNEKEVWGWDIWWDLDYEVELELVELEQELVGSWVGRLGVY
jgi:hypothetical protein